MESCFGPIWIFVFSQLWEQQTSEKIWRRALRITGDRDPHRFSSRSVLYNDGLGRVRRTRHGHFHLTYIFQKLLESCLVLEPFLNKF